MRTSNRAPELYLRLVETRLRRTLQKTRKSVLLLGPRQTGKSTLISGLLPELVINLARERTFLEFSSDPALLEKVIEEQHPRTIFIDEVQRIPSLLNTIQAILDENPKGPRFLLTGSSARKLKRGQANLLPGRVISHFLSPLLDYEMRDSDRSPSLENLLKFGSLPGIVTASSDYERQELLRTYASTYLKEEVQAEALTRNIEGFARFLMVAASKSGEFLDLTKLGTLASIPQKTSSRFFEILEDTLIVHRLNAYAHHETTRLVRHPKYYFFDCGVLNGTLGNFQVSGDRKGLLFEHWIINQIIHLNTAIGEPARLSTYRTEAGSEIDLIIEQEDSTLLVEIKAAQKLASSDFRGIRRFRENYPKRNGEGIVIYDGPRAYREDQIQVLPWREALEKIRKKLGG